MKAYISCISLYQTKVTQLSNRSDGAVGLGLIGAGHQGRNLGTALKEVKRVKLTAISDVSEDVAKRYKDDFNELGIEDYYLDYHDLLSRTDVDAVLIVVPHDLLKKVAIDALEAGKHVFIEKPMALNGLEAKEIINSAESRGSKLMVGYCMRYLGVRQMMKDLLKRKAVGKINMVNAGKACATVSGWLADPTRGGGVLLYIGVHLIDQVLWMIENEAQRVFAEIGLEPQRKIDEKEVFTIHFGNGVLANLNCSMQPWYRVGTIGYDFLEVLGADGYIRSDWPRNTLQVYAPRLPEYKNPTTVQIYEAHHLFFTRELQEFVNAILNDRNPSITGKDALEVLKVTDAILESSMKEKPIKIGMA